MRARLEAWARRLWWQSPPPALAWALWPLSQIYRGLHAWVQRRQRRKAFPLPVPVLVVGNLVVGGAGKTPTVIALVQALQARGWRPGVVSRGQGRHGVAPCEVRPGDEAARVGDEPLVIQRRCGVPVWVGARRADAARALCAAHAEVDVLVADDGLQHGRLARQAELVVFDERGAGSGLLLPAGPLRQPLPTRLPLHCRLLYTAGQASTALPGSLATRCIHSAWPLAAWHGGDATQAQPLAALQGRPLWAAAGMAAPQKFFDMLRGAGLRFTALPLPDHHHYRHLPWPADAEVLVTEKDAVKLAPARPGNARVWVVPLDLQIPATLVAELAALLAPTGRPPAPH